VGGLPRGEMVPEGAPLGEVSVSTVGQRKCKEQSVRQQLLNMPKTCPKAAVVKLGMSLVEVRTSLTVVESVAEAVWPSGS